MQTACLNVSSAEKLLEFFCQLNWLMQADQLPASFTVIYRVAVVGFVKELEEALASGRTTVTTPKKKNGGQG